MVLWIWAELSDVTRDPSHITYPSNFIKAIDMAQPVKEPKL